MRDRPAPFSSAKTLFLIAAATAASLEAADGDLDSGFSGDGKTTVAWSNNSFADSVLPAPSSRLLVAGRMGDGRWVVSRLEEDGAMDSSWLTQFLPIDFELDGFQYSLDVDGLGFDPSGRIWLAGAVTNSVAYTPQRPALVRLQANGAADLTFDGDGRKWIPPPAGWDLRAVLDAQILPNGGAVFVGGCDDCTPSGQTAFFALRVTPEGNPDPTFAGDGWFAFDHDLLTNEKASAVAVGESGRVTLAVWGDNSGGGKSFFVARLTSGGVLDPTFGGGDGLSNLLTGSPRVPAELAIDPVRDRIYLALANANGTNSHGWFYALDWNGAVDLAWGTNGGLDVDLEEGTRLNALEVQSDGKVVAVGTINANGTQRAGFFLARATVDGDLDDSFDDNGVKRVEFDRTPDAVDNGLAVALWGGRLVAAGVANNNVGDGVFAVLRTRSTLIFTDGFERGTAGAWSGN